MVRRDRRYRQDPARGVHFESLAGAQRALSADRFDTFAARKQIDCFLTQRSHSAFDPFTEAGNVRSGADR